MKLSTTFILSLFSISIFSQIQSPFEFLDQFAKVNKITSLQEYQSGIAYTSYSRTENDGGSRLNIVKPDGSLESHTILEATHDRAELFQNLNGDLYAAYYNFFECDFSP